MQGISHWDNFLLKEEYDFVWEEFEKFKWEHIAGENPENVFLSSIQLRTFWFKDLIESKIEPLFKNKIETFLNCKIESKRLYGNGQTTSQDAFVHRDQEPKADDTVVYGTLVYYLHKSWMPHFGGNLIFVEESKKGIVPKVTASIFPATNSAVLFNSYLQHMAFAPSVYCSDMRTSIGYKFSIKQNQESNDN